MPHAICNLLPDESLNRFIRQLIGMKNCWNHRVYLNTESQSTLFTVIRWKKRTELENIDGSTKSILTHNVLTRAVHIRIILCK